MRTLTIASVLSLGCVIAANAQTDWPSFGGDSQRTGWERSDTRIKAGNVEDFELVLKRQFPDVPAGPRALTPPVVVGLLISYRGFKELALVADNSGTIWSLDADLNRVFWKRQLAPVQPAAGCSPSATAMPGLVPPRMFGARSSTAGQRRPALPGNGFGEVRPVFAVSGDGKLHKLNTSDGSDISAPINFLPAGTIASPLTIHDGTIYAASQSNCGGAASGIWAIDLTASDPTAVNYTWQGPSAPGLGGPAFGTDGTVYLQTVADTILSFTPNNLMLKARFTLPTSAAGSAELNVPTPVVFPFDGKDLIVSSSSDGRLFVLDAKSFGGPGHNTPLSQTQPLAAAGGGIWGALSSWRDPDGNRWVLAPVQGKLNPGLKPSKTNGPVSNGAIVAFRVEVRDGKPILNPMWASRDISSPLPPVITSGAVFALSAGPTHAVLYGLNAKTGEEIYSTGKQVTAPATLTGLTLSNGRVYFTTVDGTLYAFGVHLEI